MHNSALLKRQNRSKICSKKFARKLRPRKGRAVISEEKYMNRG